jgi:hypothetical protein
MSHKRRGAPDPRRNAVFISHSAKVIYLKERNVAMLRKDLILRNPLRLLDQETDDILPAGGFGAVLACAGVGKTALMVQIALNALLRDKNVLHISLNEPVHKVSLWYEEVFRNITQSYELHEMNELWETILVHRFIMTFQVDGFSVPRLKERLTDLTAQGIFFPQMIILDGLPFDKPVNQILTDLKTLATDYRLPVWLAVRTHHHEESGSDGLPIQIDGISELFNVAIQLQPEGKEVLVKALKGGNPAAGQPNLYLDPSTLLIKDKMI